jgi:hypothetical protein
MEPFHWRVPFVGLMMVVVSHMPTPQLAASPWQQFSVR